MPKLCSIPRTPTLKVLAAQQDLAIFLRFRLEVCGEFCFPVIVYRERASQLSRRTETLSLGLVDVPSCPRKGPRQAVYVTCPRTWDRPAPSVPCYLLPKTNFLRFNLPPKTHKGDKCDLGQDMLQGWR
eukprot:scaffold53919_cov64-Phaeocystis_antarctica.AAC.2